MFSLSVIDTLDQNKQRQSRNYDMSCKPSMKIFMRSLPFASIR